jgi:multidrug efflux pump
VDFPTISVQAGLPGRVRRPWRRRWPRRWSARSAASPASPKLPRPVRRHDAHHPAVRADRNIDGAARRAGRDNAARSLLPTGLPSNPTYRKVNPADAPIMILALTSNTMNRGQMYDAASTILAQKLSRRAWAR